MAGVQVGTACLDVTLDSSWNVFAESLSDGLFALALEV